jgi:hypothetical protein
MVGGNSMAHLYLEPEQRVRGWWPQLAPRWDSTLQALMDRPSIDLGRSVDQCRSRARASCAARRCEIVRSHNGHDARWTYCAMDGDPLQLGGSLHDLDADAAWEAGANSAYPDGIVQLSTLCQRRAAGHRALGGTDWDLRARYEPRRMCPRTERCARADDGAVAAGCAARSQPQRTTDVVPSALDVLGVERERVAVRRTGVSSSVCTAYQGSGYSVAVHDCVHGSKPTG